MVTIFVSDSVWGPFAPYEKNPLLSHRDYANPPFQNIGHADFVRTDSGEWHVFLLGVRPRSLLRHNLGREVFAKQFSWDGFWPDLGREIRPHEPMPAKQIRRNCRNYEWRKLKTIPPEWCSVRIDYSDFTELTPGGLVLKAFAADIGEGGATSLLLHRQEEYRFSFTATLDLAVSSGANGIAVLNGGTHHATMLIENGKILIKKQCYDIVQRETHALEQTERISLVLRGDEDQYYFGIKEGNKTKIISRMRTEILATEVSSSPFTGTLFGLFSKGRGTKGIFVDSLILLEEPNYEEHGND